MGMAQLLLEHGAQVNALWSALKVTRERRRACITCVAIEERQKFPSVLVWHMESATSLSWFLLLRVYITGSACSALPVTPPRGPCKGTRCRLRLIGLGCEDLK